MLKMNKKQTVVSSRELALTAAGALSEKQGVDILAFDVAKTSQITDFYVVVTAKNPPHMKAMANELRMRMKDKGVLCFKKAGDPESGWIVADYIDVVVHILSEDARQYYALEELWKDAKVLQINDAL